MSMIHVCKSCNKLIRDGERVTVTVSASYHTLKSTVAYALDKQDMIADSDTLKHDPCGGLNEGD
jgi:hypothetical protein